MLGHWLANELTCLVGPCARNIPHRVATASEDDHGYAETLNVAHAIGVPIHAEIETTQPVARETVTTTLENDGFWAVIGHDSLDGRLEDVLVCLIRDAVTEGEINSIIFACSDTNVAKLAGAREVLAILVERDCHNAIGRVKGFLNTVTVVHVNVDVEYALLVPQEFDNAEDNV